ncbi:MAG TPA: hypothetical protein VGQ09_14315 [Chitinophagaceae bacterium]|jgi:hypothetical protein|nr:hypothetical protein [Chitinophagaceae bacterium]
MNKKQKDRHLDVPSEANRDKHINFVAEERGEIDPAEEPSTGPLANKTVDKPIHEKNENKKRKKGKD